MIFPNANKEKVRMRTELRSVGLAYAAGSLGGLINGLLVWGFGFLGGADALKVKILPALTTVFIYSKLVWGGIWGFLLLLPFLTDRPAARGILISIPPTLVQLFYVFPHVLNKGYMGVELGALTPLLVVSYNLVWGLVASYFYYYASESPKKRWF
jgi:hypothetical protein